ncbi:MAG: zinc ribbon domain-containing protein [Polyangiaceae bacterium]|nr:zinc ribbon domain-containing protein [Polyangiaceae bacterium]
MAYFVGSLIGSFIAGWIWVRIARLAAPASAKARWVFLIALAIPSAGVLIPDTSNAERVEMWLMHFLSVAFWSRRYRASLGEKSDAPTLPPTDEDTNPSLRARRAGESSTRVACPSCSLVNGPAARFCKRCGVSLAPAVCRSCSRKNDSDAKFCEGCGADLAK